MLLIYGSLYIFMFRFGFDGERILDAIFHEDSLEDVLVVEMMDVEEKIWWGRIYRLNMAKWQTIGGNDIVVKLQVRIADITTRKRRRIGQRTISGPKVKDIDRFITDTCKCLKEKEKRNMVYTAMGYLGASALIDLVKEVNAIQACEGQKTAWFLNGKLLRLRTF